MRGTLENLRAKYDTLYQNLLKKGAQAHNVKEIRIATGKCRAILDSVELLDRMLACADPSEEALTQVRAHIVEAKEKQLVGDSFTAGVCLGYRLGYELILKDLDTPGGVADLLQEEARQQDAFPLTPETLQQLPPFVAAVVNDYATHDEAQRWSLHDIQYDLQSLNALPIDEDSTCEIWTHGWVWRGRKGTVSLSPQIVEPQEEEGVFAWVVEREHTDAEHIWVWRLRCQELDPHLQKAQPKPLSKQDVFALARTFGQQETLVQVMRMVERAYGKTSQVARVLLQGGDNPLGGALHYRHLDSLTVFGHDGNKLSPDFAQPFWQERSDLDLLLARPGDECYNDAVDGYDDPAEGTPAYCLAVALDDLIHTEYGPLEAEVRYEINLQSEENQKLLLLPFPQLFGYLPSSVSH